MCGKYGVCSQPWAVYLPPSSLAPGRNCVVQRFTDMNNESQFIVQSVNIIFMDSRVTFEKSEIRTPLKIRSSNFRC